VLVADDQAEARAVLVKLLRQFGVGDCAPGCVDSVGDGNAALQMLAQAQQQGAPYQLLMLDWIMPGMDGAALLQALYAPGAELAPTVVIVSAFDPDDMHASAAQFAVTRFLPKPVLPDALRQVLGGLHGEPVAAANAQQPRRPAALPPPVAVVPAPARDWPPNLTRLKLLLAECSFDAIDLWQNEKPAFTRMLSMHSVHRISLALENYDFDVALDLLPKD
jgi:CheY-like chemotaxis protein